MHPTNLELIEKAADLARLLPTISSLDLEPVTVDGGPSVQQNWRHVSKQKPHLLHGVVSRVGGFPPMLARYFIHKYSTKGSLVADPFCGKGTTLLEALIAGRNAVGGDVAPDAVYITRAKLTQLSISDVASYIQKLPTGKGVSVSEVIPNVRLFYSVSTMREIVAIRRHLLEDIRSSGRKKDIATFVLAVMLGLLHGHSRLSLSLPCNQAFAMSPNYVKKYVNEHKLERPQRSVHRSLLERSLQLLPFAELKGKGKAYNLPAQKCDKYVTAFGSNADLILTSPPYLNRQTYVKDSWLRLWLTDAEPHRDKASLETGSISKFVQSMSETLLPMAKSLRKGGRAVLVCGQAKIDVLSQPRPVKIAELCLYALDQLGSKVPLKAEQLIIDRVMMKRGSYFAVHHGLDKKDCPTKAKRYGEDEILILKKT